MVVYSVGNEAWSVGSEADGYGLILGWLEMRLWLMVMYPMKIPGNMELCILRSCH